MNPESLLAHLDSLGVRLTADGERLRVTAAPGSLSDECKALIGEHKPQLLVLLAARSDGAEGEYPVSFAQRRLWFLDQLEPGNSAYHLGAAHGIDSTVDVAAMESALNDVLRRQSALRTVFRAVDGEPMQVVRPFQPIPLVLVDLSDLPAPDRDEVERRHTRDEAARPFSLANGPLIRTTLLRLGNSRYQLLFTLHHIVCDGWSLGIFLENLHVAYAARLAGTAPVLPPLTIHFGAHATRERATLSGATLDNLLSYWRGRLISASPTLELPTDRPRPRLRRFDGAVVTFALTPALSEGLRALARSEHASLYMTLLAVFKTLLFRYSGQSDIVVGTPVANRPTRELESVIGMFVGTLPIRSDLTPDLGLRDLIAQIRENVLDAQTHSALPFEKMVDELRPTRNLAWSPVFQVVFTLQNTPLASNFAVTTVASMYDLSLFMWDEPGGIRGALEYNTSLFDAATAERMRDHFVALAESAVAAPEQSIGQLRMLTATQRSQVLVDWNNTTRPYPRNASLQSLFEVAASRWPQAIAVESAEPEAEVLPVARLSYAELSQASSRLAQRLRDYGVQPGDAVGLYVERSIGAIVAMLAIVKAGAAYVPLDIGDPPARTSEMLRDAGIRTVLSQHLLADRLRDTIVATIILEREWAATGPAPALPDEGSADAPAYIMFTSGTTGVPKGVCITHRNVARLVCNADYAELGPDETLLQLAPLAFDASTLEIWGALLNGSRLVVYPPGMPTTGALALVLRSQRISTLWLTTGFFHQMVESELTALAGVRQVLAGGDVLSVSHVQRLLDAKQGGIVVNAYGPTENTTFTCCHRMAPGLQLGATVLIGRPISNTRVYVLDPQGEPVPPGVAGELFAGGDGVARGYLANPAVNAEKFLPDPFGAGTGATMYRTGDLVRWRTDGTLEFLGRRDRQVKVRGFRIELEAVEDALRGCPGVRDAAVLAHRDAAGTNALVGYLVPRSADPIDLAAVKLALAGQLPAYMVPGAFVTLAALPLTPNGKLDRAALPKPAATLGRRGVIEPRTFLETQLHVIWERVLGRSGIGVTENFFDLGGHSLLAMRLFAQIERVLGLQLPVSALFTAPDIEQFAKRLEHEGFRSAWSSLVTIQGEGTQRPLFMVPGIGGNVLCYGDLARQLGPDQPFYGLQARGLDEREQPFKRIEPMAAHYLSEVRKFQPSGPYRIGGSCFGGVVAYEMAQQLRAAGEEVELLFLLESWPPPRLRPLVDTFRVRSYRIRFLIYAVKRHLAAMRKLSLRQQVQALLSGLKIISEMASTGDVYRGDQASMYVDRVSVANQLSLLHYDLRPYDGAVRFATAAQRSFVGEDTRRQWRTLAPRDYAAIDLPVADSGLMLLTPGVELLATWMRGELAGLDAKANSQAGEH